MVKKVSRFQSLRANSDYSAVPAVSSTDLDEIEVVLKKLFGRFGVSIE